MRTLIVVGIPVVFHLVVGKTGKVKGTFRSKGDVPPMFPVLCSFIGCSEENAKFNARCSSRENSLNQFVVDNHEADAGEEHSRQQEDPHGKGL